MVRSSGVRSKVAHRVVYNVRVPGIREKGVLAVADPDLLRPTLDFVGVG